MRAVLVTGAQSRSELESDWAVWLEYYGGRKPDLIVGHRDLAFAVDVGGEDQDQALFHGVRFLDLSEFDELNDHLRVKFPRKR